MNQGRGRGGDWGYKEKDCTRSICEGRIPKKITGKKKKRKKRPMPSHVLDREKVVGRKILRRRGWINYT